ncbi:13_t:CDS:2, partial [Funneliformis caledonium]
FKVVIEKEDSYLIEFFDMIVNVIISNTQSAYNKEEIQLVQLMNL